MTGWNLLLAEQVETVYRLNRLQTLTEGWHWLAILGVISLIVAYVVILYRRDAKELSSGVRWSLVVLRATTFLAILFFFLDLERGIERTLVVDSRLAILVDVSQSMSIKDPDPETGSMGESRIGQVHNVLANSTVLNELRKKHAVTVYQFGSSALPEAVASYPKEKSADVSEGTAAQQAKRGAEEAGARQVAYAGLGLAGLAALAAIIYLAFGRGAKQGEGASWALLVAMVATIAALIVLAVASLRVPHTNILALVGLIPPTAQEGPSDDTDEETITADQSEVVELFSVAEWEKRLSPEDRETRLGDAIKAIVQKERGGPIAGIAILTDGGSNAGSSLDVAATLAQEARVRLFPVGIGSTSQPSDVRVVDLEAPQRVYPGDRFRLKGFLQAFQLDGQSLRVTLKLRSAGAGEEVPSILLDEKTVEVEGDGDTIPVEFDAEPPPEGGKWTYVFEVQKPTSVTRRLDKEEREASDNQETRYRKLALVEVVDEQSKVLLIAGGATREYRFLRDTLHRDKDVSLDVLLQTAEPGTAQEGDNLLFQFPEDTEMLFEYDCIVAFDPDWLAFNEAQIRLVERWVAEKAGGLIVVCGPVFTPEWSRMSRGNDDRVDLLKGLYPVQFIRDSSAAMTLGKIGGDTAWPLQFTRDGQSSKFLWLADDAIENEQLWGEFEGVFGYFAVRDSKQGATIYARFSDPSETSLDDQLPIYLASHFYGAGRVYFQASGEMWRLRALDTEYFAQYYTKLVRWVSQGRLLRDSSRGVLLVDKERAFVGDIVTMSAVLTDTQFRPLTNETVDADRIDPDGTRTRLTLRALQESSRQGEYQTQFTVTENGDYRIELAPPESRIEELLTAKIKVSSSKAETQDPLLNQADLEMLAERSDGQYFPNLSTAASGSPEDLTLLSAIAANDQETVMPGAPDRLFKETLMWWLMALMVGVLSLEWLIRRLSKLA
jgi:hypothetical protein